MGCQALENGQKLVTYRPSLPAAGATSTGYTEASQRHAVVAHGDKELMSGLPDCTPSFPNPGSGIDACGQPVLGAYVRAADGCRGRVYAGASHAALVVRGPPLRSSHVGAGASAGAFQSADSIMHTLDSHGDTGVEVDFLGFGSPLPARTRSYIVRG